MLTRAKALLREVLDALRPEIAASTPVVGLEPSCVAVFRDELLNMLPHDEDAKRLSKQTFTFAEFLAKRLDWEPPHLDAQAVVHGHCHYRAIERGMECDRQVLGAMGLDFQILDTGCCGMAGPFGYQAGEHFDVSVKVAEHSLLPKLREAEERTLVIADGFSCREQIEQLGDRKALHLAQVLQQALRESGRTGPEATEADDHDRHLLRYAPLAAAGIAAGAAGAAAVRRNRS
jgi:Fe-S oxidoreductase